MAFEDPIAASGFGISIDGVQVASFSELQGITTDVDVIEYFESTDTGVRVMRVPGTVKANNKVTFKMAMSTNLEMNAWLEAAQAGRLNEARKSCSLVMYNSVHEPIARFYLQNAWPVSCKLSALRAGSAEVLQQEWTLTYEGIQRVL
jgi:phage tail-like protein